MDESKFREFRVYLVGNSIALIGHMDKRQCTIRVYDEVYLVKYRTFGAVGGNTRSFFGSPQFDDLIRSPKPDLCIVFMGGDDITETTMVPDLQARLKEFCKLIENITHAPAKVSMLEPRTCLHNVQPVTYNKIRNSLNRNMQHRDPYFKMRYFITPLKFEYLSPDGIHPITYGIASFVWKMQMIARDFLHARDALQA